MTSSLPPEPPDGGGGVQITPLPPGPPRAPVRERLRAPPSVLPPQAPLPPSEAALDDRSPDQPTSLGWSPGPRTRAAIFWVLVILAILFLHAVRDILAPFIWAIILAYLLNPLVGVVSRYTRLHRFGAVAGIYVILGLIVTWLWVAASPFVVREVSDLGAALPGLGQQLVTTLKATETIVVLGWQVDIEPLVAQVVPSINALIGLVTQRLVETAFSVIEMTLRILLTLIATFYLLIDADRLANTIRQHIPARFRAEFGPVLRDIDRIIVRFIYGQLLLVLIMSTATYIALRVLGLRYALVLAIATGFLELIPFVGPIIAGTVASVLAVVQASPYGWTPWVNAGVVALIYFILRHTEDYFVIPNVVGRVVELHPVITIFAVFSGALLGGIMGMVLAVPVAAILRIILLYTWRKAVGPEVL